ncbi:hypothetical protein FRC12_006490, partial [Ceratobasidium sp. 428]
MPIPSVPLEDSTSAYPALYHQVLDRIRFASSLSVATAISRLGNSPKPPSNEYIQLSDTPPTIFTGPDSLEASFDTWLELPVPNALQRSAIHETLAFASTEYPEVAFSLEVTYASRSVYIPVWLLNLWPTLGTLVFHSREWSSARSALIRMADTSETLRALAHEVIDQLEFIPVDTNVPRLDSFRTSSIPGLISAKS